MPLAVSATTRSGCIDVASMNDTTWSANALEQIATGRRARPARSCRTMAAEHVGSDGLDLAETGVLTDGASAAQAELDAVVLRRVVRRGEHRAGCIERAGGEVHEVGRCQTEVDDIDALLEHAADERVDQLGTRRAHVATDQDAWRLVKRAKPTPSA